MNDRMLTIIKKELTNTARSRLLWGAVGALFLIATSGIISTYLRRPSPGSPNVVAENIALNLYLFLPLVALLIGYKSIVGERESGSIRFLFTLPTTRREVVLGKLLGRSLVFVLIFLTTVSLLIAETILLYGRVGLSQFVLQTGFLFLYGWVWVSVAVGISAAVTTRVKATAGVLGLYVTTHYLWRGSILPIASFFVTGDASIGDLNPIQRADGPTWYLYFQRLNPVEAYQAGRSTLRDIADSGATGVAATETDLLSSPETIFGFTMLLLWSAVPLLAGYWRFKRAEFE